MMMMMSTQKRKAVDQVNHDFSDFSLSSPATKIRRLDHAELTPIMEEDEQEEQTIAAAGAVENEERAIVVFNPNNNNTIIDPSPTFSLTPHFLSRFKGRPDLRSILSNNPSARDRTLEEEDDDNDYISNQSLAVVPWVSSHLSPPPPPLDAHDNMMMMMMMEAELENQQEEVSSMDIEQEFSNNGYAPATATQQTPANEFGFHHCQQHHCMVPSQLPHNAAAAAAPPAPTPVVWFR